ncbi:MAG TPA: NAD(P)/FAD-dependent oxidoreductase [Cyclobacteriaceae bacterium]|nr:NAD(P)/FAD-dependent oxidoreductase [Cyclobacteriaceae bacterium]
MLPIIIIGAGAAGLSAANVLGRSGREVVVLEARDRIGGRIFTSHDKRFSVPIETGAEFIHGDLPHTHALAKSAHATLRDDSGRQWKVEGGQKEEEEFFDAHWDKLIGALEALEEDMAIAEFLDQVFPGKQYAALRESVIRFVEGFDAADAKKASARALREEWTNTDATKGYHVVGGYSLLMVHLFERCRLSDVMFHFSSVVREIYWERDKVTVICDNGARYDGQKLLITIPPAVLRTGSIQFFPKPEEHLAALNKIETGGVIKFLVEFKEPEWENDDNDDFRQFPDAHFIFSDAWIPTWWTQTPSPTPLLTGWLSGPVINTIKLTDEILMDEAVKALGYIFDCREDVLRSHIRAVKVINWMEDPFARGAYAYKTVETPAAIEVLTKPLNDTVYFAGEAYHSGPEMGTVEAALVSGENTARSMNVGSMAQSLP